ncbi:hypothetical protein LIER_08190 [Lithospermum erythrorhizon]|uniref:Uncharacterized protein n=1 Tax=Lithospermum erythrorhizon TaxID=34254 RepID=A0AAV3PEZ4_LITER
MHQSNNEVVESESGKWKISAENWIKINNDAKWCKESGKCYTGHGRFLGAQFEDISIAISALMAESITGRAHLVAHWDCGLEHMTTWLEAPPHWLHATLLQDCTE